MPLFVHNYGHWSAAVPAMATSLGFVRTLTF